MKRKEVRKSAHIYKQIDVNKVQVRFLKTHIGHENKLCHFQILPSNKLEIAGRLAQKVPKCNILNDIRDSYAQGDLN